MVKQNKFVRNSLCAFYIAIEVKAIFLFENISSFYKVCSCVVSAEYGFIISQHFSLMTSAKVMDIYSIFIDKSDCSKPGLLDLGVL